MTADSPASGLPQEAVERRGPLGQRLRTLAKIADATEGRINADGGTLHDAADAVLALAAERDKVAALQQAVDKVRALHKAYLNDPARGCSVCDAGRRYKAAAGTDRWDRPTFPCATLVALLPDVQADDRGTTTPTPATTCADCGTTRTICAAGLNTYDTRCCEQCGHGAA